MTDRDLLELIATQVGKLTIKVDGLTTRVEGLTTQVDGLTTRMEGLTTQVDGLTTRMEGLTTQVDGLTKDLAEVKATMATKQELAEVKSEVSSIKAIVIRIENDHGQKLGALFNGYKLMSERLDRIDKEVAEHEEIISKRLN